MPYEICKIYSLDFSHRTTNDLVKRKKPKVSKDKNLRDFSGMINNLISTMSMRYLFVCPICKFTNTAERHRLLYLIKKLFDSGF